MVCRLAGAGQTIAGAGIRIVAPRLWGRATAPASVLLQEFFASPASRARWHAAPWRMTETERTALPGRSRAASLAGLDRLAHAGGATLRWTRTGAREYGALRPRDDADESEPGRDDERDRLMHVLRDDDHSSSPADASASRRKARSISPRGNARARSTGRRPDARLAADRAGKQRVQVAWAEMEARQSRSRRLQMDWEEVEERAPKPYALWCVIGANCVVFILWQDTSMRRFMGKNSQKFSKYVYIL